MRVSSLRGFCNSFQSLAAENLEWRPKVVWAFGVTREMYLLERRLRVGNDIDTSERRYRVALPSKHL